MAEGHQPSTTDEIDIVGDQNGLLVVTVDRDVVVARPCQTSVSYGPAFVTGLPQKSDDPCIDVMIEDEPQRPAAYKAAMSRFASRRVARTSLRLRLGYAAMIS